MKRVFVIILVLSTFVFAQENFRLIGGVNFSNIKWNDENIQDAFDPKPLMGFNIGIENQIKNIIIGLSYVQRGMKSEDFIEDGLEFTMTMNYITGFALLSLSPDPNSSLSLFIGGEFGKYLSGEVKATYEDESDTEDIDADEINLDYGILGGAQISLNDKIGIRGSYYFGLANIDDVDDDDMTGKHNCIQVMLTYKL